MKFTARSWLPHSAERLYRWHLAPGALGNLCPAWESVRLSEPDQGIYPGLIRRLQVSPLRIPWWAEHRDFVADRQFCDRQQRGPFRSWTHYHRFLPETSATGPGEGSWLVDEVDFQLPFFPLSRPLEPWLLQSMQRLFLYRHRVTRQYLDLLPDPGEARALRLAVTGASGLIGRRLVPFLRSGGHRVVELVRRRPLGGDEVFWDPQQVVDLSALEGFDAIIHLAGHNLLQGNYGTAHREQIRRSRVEGTQHLVQSLLALRHPPLTWVSASGIAYYGSSQQQVSEQSAGGPRGRRTAPPGSESAGGPRGRRTAPLGFLAEVCRDWEAASEPLEGIGVRRVLLRLGAVLHLSGGALPPLRRTAAWGWGLSLGSLPLNWIALEDVLGLLGRALLDQRWSGPINGVAPQQVTMSQATRLLGGARQIELPRHLLGRILGQRREWALSETQVEPTRALELGYRFLFDELAAYLPQALGRFTVEDQPQGWSFHSQP